MCFNNSTPKKEVTNLYVINYEGAKIYDTPNFKSKSKKRLKNGQNIAIQDSLNRDELTINTEITLRGYWLKLVDNKGYVFSSDFTKIKPAVEKSDIITVSLLGKKLKTKTVKQREKINEKYFEVENVITTYDNATYQYIALDGCWDHIYTFDNLSFSEVYHHTMNQYIVFYGNEDNQTIEKPKFIKRNDFDFVFEGVDATIELIIRTNKDGKYETYSYDCT